MRAGLHRHLKSPCIDSDMNIIDDDALWSKHYAKANGQELSFGV